MDEHNLSIYLNDHLAGSTAALELLKILMKIDGLESFATRLQVAISEDRAQLESLIGNLSMSVSTGRKVVGWFTEKLAELKIGIDDRGAGSLKRLECLEALALGVDGKHALWRALEALAASHPALAALDYSTLQQRAVQQRQDIEERRLSAAVEALGRPRTMNA